MKKHTYSIALLCLSVLFIFSACNKESSNSGTLPPPDNSYRLVLSNAFAGLRSAPEELEVNAGSFQVVHGMNNTRLVFYPNSFKDKNGSIITTGQIKIKLIEMYRPGQMIANRSSTTASGRLLISGGQVHIKAYRAGQEVYPTVYGIGFPQPAASGQPMNLFYGANNNEDSTTTWDEASRNAGTIAGGTVVDTVTNRFVYQFDSCTNFNWINCDYFYNYTQPLTNMSIVVKDSFNTFNDTNTQVFLVFPAINSVTWFQAYDPATHAFSFTPNYFVPVGMNFHTVSISVKNGTYYYDQKLNLTVTNNLVDTLKPQPQTLSYIISTLGSL
jgi:hypothetical protein